MNLTKPGAVIYITPTSVVVAGRKVAAVRLPLEPDIYSNLEVINHGKFVEQCRRFFVEQGLKGKRVIIVLDPRVTFNKTLPLDKVGNPGALRDAFVAAMPFEAGQRACVTVNAGSELRLYATNAELFGTVEEALRLTGRVKVTAVTPAVAYDLSSIEKSFAAAAALYIRDDTIAKNANFLDKQPY